MPSTPVPFEYPARAATGKPPFSICRKPKEAPSGLIWSQLGRLRVATVWTGALSPTQRATRLNAHPPPCSRGRGGPAPAGDGLPDVVRFKDRVPGSWPVPDLSFYCTIYLGGGGYWSRASYTVNNDALCWSASIQGDVNGDGYADLVAGDPGNWGNSSRVLVYHGGVDADSVEDERLESPSGVLLRGWSVAAADVDGDGFADVAFGQPDVVGQVPRRPRSERLLESGGWPRPSFKRASSSVSRSLGSAGRVR